tara:strand:+ start:12693 stop:13388 length:696 start_codon:yes stop_codon:yes gene_type:complete
MNKNIIAGLLAEQTELAKHHMLNEQLGISIAAHMQNLQAYTTGFVTSHKDESPEVLKANKLALYAMPKQVQATINKNVACVIEMVDGKRKTVWKPKTDKNGKVQKHMSEDALRKLNGNVRKTYSRALTDLGLVTADKRGGQKKRIEAAKLESKEAWATVDGVKETLSRFSDMVKTPAFLAMMNSDKKIQGSVLAITATMTSNAEFFAVEKPASEVSKTVKKGNRTKHTIGK